MSAGEAESVTVKGMSYPPATVGVPLSTPAALNDTPLSECAISAVTSGGMLAAASRLERV